MRRGKARYINMNLGQRLKRCFNCSRFFFGGYKHDGYGKCSKCGHKHGYGHKGLATNDICKFFAFLIPSLLVCLSNSCPKSPSVQTSFMDGTQSMDTSTSTRSAAALTRSTSRAPAAACSPSPRPSSTTSTSSSSSPSSLPSSSCNRTWSARPLAGHLVHSPSLYRKCYWQVTKFGIHFIHYSIILQYFPQDGKLAQPLVYSWEVDDVNDTTWGDPIHRLHIQVERGRTVYKKSFHRSFVIAVSFQES